MKPEQKFWQLVKDHVPGEKDRIENMAMDGMPDVSAAWEGSDFWIELKVSGNKKKLADVAGLCRPAQRVWHYARFRQGSKIFVAVQYSFAVVLYRCKGYRVYEQIAYCPSTGPGYNWNLFENNLKRSIKGELNA
jgi:hypothetical protein